MSSIQVEVGEVWRESWRNEENGRDHQRDFMVVAVDRVEGLVERIWLSLPAGPDGKEYVNCVRWKTISDDKVVPRQLKGVWPFPNCVRRK